MQNIVQWFQKKLPIIKIIFLISVVVVVVMQLSTIGKTIDFGQVGAIFSSLGWWKLVLMLLIGLIAVTPMLGYDVTLNQLLKQKPKKRYLLETSWSINTINNMVGFGGIINIGLRSEIYGKGSEGKKVIQSLSKILLFLMSGLSAYSLISVLLIFFDVTNPFISNYWIWLVGGSLYFPLVLVVTKWRKDGLLGGLSQKHRWQLFGISILEWTGVVATFLLVGALMGISFSPLQVIPMFIAASVIGIVSMIPGELGSFDVMMILGLSSMGIPREIVVSWILLYRLFYYVIPFAIGSLLLFKNLGTGLDQRYHGIPQELLREIAHKILVFALYFSGSMMVLLATIPEAFTAFSWLNHINPWRLHLISQFPSLLLGFLLIIMGRGVANRSKKAYLPTIILLVLASLYIFFSNFSVVTLIFLLLLLVTTIFSKKELYREQFVYAWEEITKDSLLLIALVVLYLGIGIYNLPAFPHHLQHHYDFLLFPSEKAWLAGLIAILIVAVFLWLFVRYLEGKKKVLGNPINEKEVYAVLEKFGGNSDSQLAFLGDKRVYFYHDGTENTVFFQMNTYNNKCIIMGDPSGKEADFSLAIQQLIEEADTWGYQPVFYEVSENIVMLLHEFGYDFIKMGESAEVDLGTFTISGKRMKGQRALMNRLKKENYTFEVLQPPFDAAFMQDLRQISDEWLNGRKEKGFSLGFYSEQYLQRGPIAVAKNDAGEIVAFANIMPTYTETIGTIDLMRHSPSRASAGTMDFLFINLFDYMKEQGLATFDLGMAPLANVGTSRKSFIQERVAYLVYQFGSHFYSFQGLRDYKDKYASTWTSRYTAYSRDSWIIYVMSALLIIDNAPVEKNRRPLRGIRKYFD